MTDSRSNSSFDPFDLELPMSTSNCSLDVSVLSLDSSCSSFGSMSQLHKEKRVHKRRASRQSKFNHYKGGPRWNNTVDAFGSAGMNTAPFRKPSCNRLSNPRLHMTADAAANVPCRKCSHNNLMMSSPMAERRSSMDGPAHFPTRQESQARVSDHSGNPATAALHKLNNFRRSANKPQNRNFEWSFSSSRSSSQEEHRLNARTFPPLMESVFNVHQPSALERKKKNPPVFPTRRPSHNVMEFNLLKSFESTCSGSQQPQSNTNMMPPPIPSRKESLMDFDDVSHQILPPPPPSASLNSSWPPTMRTSSSIRVSDPDHHHHSSSRGVTSNNTLFLAMPPMTNFERQVSSTSRTSTATAPPPMPRRKSSSSQLLIQDPEEQAPALPRARRMDLIHDDEESSINAAVPQRKESLMDIQDAVVPPQRKESLMDIHEGHYE